MNKRKLKIGFSSLLLTFLATAFVQSQEKIDLCEGLVQHKDDVKIDRYEKPPFMQYYRDPAFSSKVIRITDGPKGSVLKPAYSTMQAWNADESFLMLYESNGGNTGHILFDGTTYERVKKLDIVPVDLEEVFWSFKDPEILYYVSAYFEHYGQFIKYNVVTDEHTILRDFREGMCTKMHATASNDVMMQSWDDDLFGFRCKTDEESISFSYRISTDTLTKIKSGEGTPWYEATAPMPTPSGERFYKEGFSLASDMTQVLHKLDLAEIYDHGSLGRTWDGQDALFRTVFDRSPKKCNGSKSGGVGHLTEFNLETGKCRSIISTADGWPYTASGTHVSAVAYKQPGWVAMSSVGYGKFKHFKNGKPAPALTSEIYLANTNPDNMKVCRLAQHRSYAKDSENENYNPYFGEPHATISPSGTRIVYGSDWYDSGSVDTYVIELPAYKRAN